MPILIYRKGTPDSEADSGPRESTGLLEPDPEVAS